MSGGSGGTHGSGSGGSRTGGSSVQPMSTMRGADRRVQVTERPRRWLRRAVRTERVRCRQASLSDPCGERPQSLWLLSSCSRKPLACPEIYSPGNCRAGGACPSGREPPELASQGKLGLDRPLPQAALLGQAAVTGKGDRPRCVACLTELG